MIKCKINGNRNNLEEIPVDKTQEWYSYRTEDHYMVIDLPCTPKEMISMKAKIIISGIILEIGK